MSCLLVVDSTPSGADDYLFSLSNFFLDLYTKNYPSDTVEILRLYDVSIPFLTKSMFVSMMSPEGAQDPMKRWVSQFKKFDKYLVLSPNWNLGVPSILKAYIDLITIPGETYYYDENAVPMGLLKNKKAVIMTTAYQSYNTQSEDQVFSEMNYTYLRQILSFMGVESITHFGVEGIKSHPDLVGPHLNVLRTQIERFMGTF